MATKTQAAPTKIGNPPGATRCDWCHKALAWEAGQFSQDNEFLCPKCWPTYLEIIADSKGYR